MADTDILDRARSAFRTQSWGQAYTCFGAADAELGLSSSDLELYARAAYLVGNDDACVRALERAYHQLLADGDPEQAANAAFWLAFNLMNRGEMARAGGWLGRVEQLVPPEDSQSPVRGLLLLPTALQQLMGGDARAALGLFEQSHEIGRRSGDRELEALGGLGIGQARIALGEHAAGLAQLDEVMVAVTAGEVSPIVSGLVYCAVIVACHDTYQVQRAAEWTKALAGWCGAQPDLLPFRGQCLVHRAQILQFHGAWEDAMEQVRLACRRFSEPSLQPAIGMALYEQGELHRLRGEHAAAADAYSQASRHGHETQPGLALLRLAQGNHDAARAGLLRALDESDGGDRPRLLAAWVVVALETGSVPEAREAAEALGELASRSDSPLLHAMSAEATGSVLLAEDDPRAALEHLRRAWRLWRDLDAPYPAARVRRMQAEACRRLGDVDAAQMELRAAAEIFEELGARPDLVGLRRLGSEQHPRPGGLTQREAQVLRILASGRSNRAIAAELCLSEKTVARHLSNIFTKIGVSSRAAATAYAYEHELV
jgi:DNA-binding CsgD family transcriptional regulator